jgi:ParB-like chromosome segregation protein Spo0J
VATVATSIQEFGWRQPIVVDEAMVVLAGHTRLEAARKLGFKTAPVHVAKGLTASQARAFRIMDNRSSENAEWDKDLLNLELADLLEADFDLGLTGFTEDELNALMSSLEEGTGPQEGEDDVPETPEDPISRPGDLWLLGNHRLLCGRFRTQFLHLWCCRLPGRIPRQTGLPGFQELLRPGIVQALGSALAPTHR